jgi:micrococcal nuclease
MTRKALILGLLGVLALAAAAAAPSSVARAEWFTLRGTVTRVVDGDTVHVRVGQRTEKVRLIGVDAPERGACYSAQSGAGLRQLVLRRRVVLSGDRTQPRRDVYGRLLAYVIVDGRRYEDDVLRRGLARLLVIPPNGAHARTMLAEELAARRARRGLWGAC